MTREEFIDFIDNTFGEYGIKKVKPNDISKGAYIPIKSQRKIFELSKINPEDRRKDIKVKELFTNKILTISYYDSRRIGSNRAPEYRMGLKDLISYLDVDYEVLFTRDNENIFIYNLSKLDDLNINKDEIEENIFSQIDINTLKEKVENINTDPIKVQRQINTYTRNNALRALVKVKSNYSCQIPSCNYIGFKKSNGEKYIEIHHLAPLSQEGKDSIENTVALCPTCHRKLHYAHNKEELKENLKQYLKKLD